MYFKKWNELTAHLQLRSYDPSFFPSENLLIFWKSYWKVGQFSQFLHLYQVSLDNRLNYKKKK